MTDTAAPAAAPAAQPAAIPAEGNSDFDVRLNEFLGHSLGIDEPQDADGDGAQTDQQTPPAGTPAAEPAPNAGAPNADANAGAVEGQGGTAAEGEPEVDPALVVAMLGMGQDPQAQPQAAPAAQPPAAPAAQPSAQPAEDEPFAPFQPNFRLPPQLRTALFESEDTDVREQALVGLLTSWGNAVMQVAEQRIAEHHAPRLMQQFTARNQEQETARAVHQDFYGTYADLLPYGQVVTRAFQIIAQKNPGAKYSPETKKQVGDLSYAVLKQMGVKFGAPAGAPAGTPVKQPPATPFVADGARPAGFNGEGVDDTSPAALFSDLASF